MKTVIRNSYTPKLGDYCETIVVDKESEDAYIFDCDGVFTPLPQPVDVEEILARAAEYTDETVAPINEKLETIEEGAQVNKIEHVLRNGTELTITNKTVNVTVPTKTSDLTNDGSDGTDTYVETAALSDYYTKDETDTQIGYETTARELADQGLQEQIDAIVASSDVVDIVGTYAALQAYDTSKLHDNDIIKVLDDETRDDATTYYRWDSDTSTWSYIGAEGPFYTKAESDATFVPQTRTINSKALSSDITLTASDVGALPDSTVIPTVNDATLTIQKNGTTVQTFTANQAANATANITVPTDTSDLTNGAGFITSAALPTKTSDLQNDGADGTSTYAETDELPTNTSDLTNDGSDGTSTYVEADELAVVATSGDYDDLLNKPTIPTVNDATLTIQKNGTDVATFTANSSTNQTANITVPTDTSDLTNGAGFITTAALANYYTKSETYSQQEVNSLINSITIPTKTSDLVNDGADNTSTYVEADELATVATTGDYDDLLNKPVIPTIVDMTGATSSTAGAHGYVPAPAAGDEDKYLKGDGTWATVSSGSSVTEFYIDKELVFQDGSTVNLYKDSGMTTTATLLEVYTAANDGGARLIYENSFTSDVATYDIFETYYDAEENAYYVAMAGGSNYWRFRLYGAGNSTAPNIGATQLQARMVAGTNISIASDGKTISASIPIDSALDLSSTNPVENSVVTAALNGKAANTDFTGATSSVAGAHGLVPAPAAGDHEKVLHGDGTWKDATAKLVEMSYGESNAWAKFIAAYNAGSIVYCRASSNANPGTGSQTRKAFMAYVNNATSPTSVEFQYVRSNSSKSDSSQCDQVFVYALSNSGGGTWSVATRDMAPKILVDSTLNKTFSGGANASVTLGAKAMTGATSGTAGTAGYVPAPAAGDQDKFLKGDGAWATLPSAGEQIFYIDEILEGESGSFYIYSDENLTTTTTIGAVVDAAKSGGAALVSPHRLVGGSYRDAEYYKVINADYDDDGDPQEPAFVVESRGNLYGAGGDRYATVATYSRATMRGASSITNGAGGAVPRPLAGDEDKFLKGDGTWAAVSSGATYTAGNGINIDANNEISVDTTVVATQSDLSGKQDTLTAGTNITINGSTISATDTTYSAFTGATSGAAGTSGLVPAPAAGDEGKVLQGDGTWATIASTATISSADWSALWQ